MSAGNQMLGHRTWVRTVPIVVVGTLSLFAGAVHGRVASTQVRSAQAATASDPLADHLQRLEVLLHKGQFKVVEAEARSLLAESDRLDAGSLHSAEIISIILRSIPTHAGTSDYLDLGQRAVEIRERRQGATHPDVAAALDLLAFGFDEAGDPERARSTFERSLAIKEQALGPEHPKVAYTLFHLASMLHKTSRYEDSRRLYERSLAIREKAFGPDHADVGVSLHGLSVALESLADYDAAFLALERALAVKEKAFGPEHFEVAVTLNSLGPTRERLGDFDGAIDSLQRAHVIIKTALGPEHPAAWIPLKNMARILQNQGAYAEARAIFERALALEENASTSNPGYVANYLRSLAFLLFEMGDYDAAKSASERALAINMRVFGREELEAAESLDVLAWIAEARADLTTALALTERALAIRLDALGRDHPSIAATLNSLGRLRFLRGDLTAAKTLWNRSLALTEKSHGANHFHSINILLNMATAAEQQKKFDEARALYNRLLSVLESHFGRGAPDVSTALAGLARIDAEAGRLPEALVAAIEAEDIRRDHLTQTTRFLAERQALAYVAKRTGALDEILRVMARSPAAGSAAIESVWMSVVRSRALVLDQVAGRFRHIRRRTDAETTRLIDDVTATSKRLANLTVRGPGNESATRFRARIDKAKSQKEDAERALAQKSVEFRYEQIRQRATLGEIAAVLPPRSAIVSFARYASRTVSFPGTAVGTNRASYAAFVLNDGAQTPTFVLLGAAESIDKLVENYRMQLQEPANASGRASRRLEGNYRTAGSALRARIWDPLTKALAGKRQIFIVPDGTLHLVDFASLPVGETQYLVETGRVIHYLSTERDLLEAEIPKAGEGILTIGAPAFDDRRALSPLAAAGSAAQPVRSGSGSLFRGKRSGCGFFESLQFEALPASALEATEIAAMWSRSPPTASAITGIATHLSGSTAGEGAFKAHAPGKQVLHLATHGFFLGTPCVSVLDAVSRSSNTAAAIASGENPLVLAGLVLAGANRRKQAGPEDEDGILTAEEIAALDLSGVEWAVLSACDTGIGEIRGSEGVFGLRRAFQIAGVRTVIMSLWQVEDESTRLWMRALYQRRFIAGRSTADAVRDASLQLLRSRRANKQSTHPLYWAGFVAAGDWR